LKLDFVKFDVFDCILICTYDWLPASKRFVCPDRVGHHECCGNLQVRVHLGTMCEADAPLATLPAQRGSGVNEPSIAKVQDESATY
jgi:hypothetical protein